ncbi:MAG: hypothetical protein H8E66_10360 [Planctomycetes bacterium]|nr:hypothetical protein [Planctomycetota bacterium]
MATLITLCVLFMLAIGGAALCRFAGRTRGRTESIIATETYQIQGQDEYTLEYRHCVTTGLYSVFALDYPPNPHDSDVSEFGLTRDGQISVAKEPRSREHAEAIAFDWMESYSAHIRTETSLHRPVGVKRRATRQSSLNR